MATSAWPDHGSPIHTLHPSNIPRAPILPRHPPHPPVHIAKATSPTLLGAQVNLANPGYPKPYQARVLRGGKLANLGSLSTDTEANSEPPAHTFCAMSLEARRVSFTTWAAWAADMP